MIMNNNNTNNTNNHNNDKNNYNYTPESVLENETHKLR